MGGRTTGMHAGMLILLLGFPAPMLARADLSSTPLPIVILDTAGEPILDEPKIAAYMGIIAHGEGEQNHPDDPHNDYAGRIAIELRGSISQGFPKKCYAFETRDEQGANRNVSLLGLPPENDWILYGAYNDKTLMRNTLTLNLLRDMGHSASRTRYCELILNGDYRGLYVLMERIKPDRARIPIEKLAGADTAGDALTGGYIIKIDKETGLETDGWTSPCPPHDDAWQRVRYQYDHPRPDRIAPEQSEYIQQFMHAFEALMKSTSYTDPWEGYYDWVKLSSFVDGLIVTELCKNVDGYRLSAFLHKNRDSIDGRLVMGPLWDFNLAFGNANFYAAWEPVGWQVEFQDERDPYPIPFWWQCFRSDPVFQNRLACRWAELRSTFLQTDALLDRLAALENEIRAARVRNFERWPIIGTHVWGNWFVGETYEEELDYLREWLLARLAWLDEAMPAPRACITWAESPALVLMASPDEPLSMPIGCLLCEAVGVDSLTLISATSGLTITADADTAVFCASECGSHAYRALAWVDGEIVEISPRYTYAVQRDRIVITEIMYNAAPEADGGDWIELHNADLATHDLSGWILRDEREDHSFTLPLGAIIMPGGYLVLVRNETAFRRIYAGDYMLLGEFAFGLGRNDQVRLYDAEMNLRDHVAYSAEPPWPTGPDGNGRSLEIIDPLADNGERTAWRESVTLHGTPGAAGPAISHPAELHVLNPSWMESAISFCLAQDAVVHVSIYDASGRVGRHLVRGEPFECGPHTIHFDGCDDRGCHLPSGLYFATLTAAGMPTRTARIAIVR